MIGSTIRCTIMRICGQILQGLCIFIYIRLMAGSAAASSEAPVRASAVCVAGGGRGVSGTVHSGMYLCRSYIRSCEIFFVSVLSHKPSE